MGSVKKQTVAYFPVKIHFHSGWAGRVAPCSQPPFQFANPPGGSFFLAWINSKTMLPRKTWFFP